MLSVNVGDKPRHDGLIKVVKEKTGEVGYVSTDVLEALDALTSSYDDCWFIRHL